MRIPSTLLILALVSGLIGAAPASGQSLSARAADIQIGGRVHTQFSRSSVASATNEVFLRRARLEFDATVNEWIDGRLHPEVSGGEVSLKDVFLRLTLSPAFRISFGQFKRSFDLFELVSSTQLPVIERDGRVEGVDECPGVGGVCSLSRLSQKLAFSDRDLGLRLEGSRGAFSWETTLTNGGGADSPDENDARSFAGRVAMEVSPGWTVGAGSSVHDWVAPGGENRYAPAWSVDLEYGSWAEGLHLMFAGIVGENWRALDAEEGPASFQTAQLLLSWYRPVGEGGPVAGVEPTVRVSFADGAERTGGDAGWLFTPAFAVYATPRNLISVNLDVYHGAAGTESSLKVQSFLYF